MFSTCAVEVQYLYGYTPDKYRTYTGQIPDNNRTSMKATSLLERRKDEGKAKVEHWRKMGRALEEDEKNIGGGWKEEGRYI